MPSPKRNRNPATRISQKDRLGSHVDELLPANPVGFKPLDAERKAKFCELVAIDGAVTMACMRLNIDRTVVRVALRDDPEFRALYDAAMGRLADSILQRVRHRAFEGDEKPIYFKGKRVDKGENREYSDRMLEMLAKRYIPEFREHTTVQNLNANVDLGSVDLSKLSPEQQQKLRELLQAPQDARPPTDPTTDV